ncbi:hypothetical protein GCM10009560_36740 [Nonomuraea longicatena]|uniref:Uncharacterized protein n=1 Tax=Nonomuraea longicatena TaxID=83682 RepID=A0ABN1PR65_9ACTN
MKNGSILTARIVRSAEENRDGSGARRIRVRLGFSRSRVATCPDVLVIGETRRTCRCPPSSYSSPSNGTTFWIMRPR